VSRSKTSCGIPDDPAIIGTEEYREREAGPIAQEHTEMLVGVLDRMTVEGQLYERLAQGRVRLSRQRHAASRAHMWSTTAHISTGAGSAFAGQVASPDSNFLIVFTARV
jgi:hypothetical protein